MTRGMMLLALVATVSACGWGQDKALRSERVEFDGIRFRADVDSVSEDRRDFTVSIRRASRSPAGAQDAAEFEAVKYCLGVFGGSDITWTVDPYQDPDTLDIGDDDRLTIAGRCTKR